MTREAAVKLIGQFGQISYNGVHYPSTVWGYIRNVGLRQIIIERLEGNDIVIPIESLKEFKPHPEPEFAK